MMRNLSTVVHSRAISSCASAGRSFIGLGSNVGDRVGNIHSALQEVSTFAKVVDTSFLYESKP